MDHELRQELNDELHNRAGQAVSAPARLSYLAFVLTDGEPSPVLSIQALCIKLGVLPPNDKDVHFATALAGGHFRFEKHGEFYRISMTIAGKAKTEALDLLPIDWLNILPGRRIVAIHTHVTVARADTNNLTAKKFFGHDDVAGSIIGQGQARLWTDFRIGVDGFSRILVENIAMDAKRMGRALRRIHEIETYRMMALMTLPLARSLMPRIGELERGLDASIAGMAKTDQNGSDAGLLAQLTKISRDAEELSSTSAYRFSAAQAYSSLVTKRIQELNEERVAGYQRVGVFLDRRFSPAIATCKVVSDRIAALTLRCERASNLLRTRVDIALEDQNQKLLESMNERALTQLRLQETVEGLSIVAISYYAVSLLAKFKEDISVHVPFHIPPILGVVLVPAVVFLVWYIMRRVRRKITKVRPKG